MSIEQYMEDYTSFERETFQRACRRLLKQTFIVRDRNEGNRKLYFFISKNPAPFSEYFQTGLAFEAFHMGIEDLVKYRNFGKSLEENDRKKRRL